MVSWYMTYDHLGAMLIVYNLTGGAEVEWDADQTLPRERGLEILNSPAAVLSIGDCSWSSVSSLMLVAVLYCCSHCGTTGGSFHNGGYSNCLLLKKPAPQWHPRWICSSPKRYACCQNAWMTLQMSSKSHMPKESFQRSTFCGYQRQPTTPFTQPASIATMYLLE